MRNQLSLQIVNGTNFFADVSADAVGTVFETDEHGYAFLNTFIRANADLAAYYYDSTTLAGVTLGNVAFNAFEGRVEDSRLVNGGIELTAFGYQRSLSDLEYTGLWSSTNLRDWRILTAADRSGSVSEQYNIDFKNRIRIDLEKNASYTTSSKCRVGLIVGGNEDLAYIEFDYDVFLPTNMTTNLNTTTTNFGGSANAETFSVNGNGASQTGSNSEALTASSKCVWFYVAASTGTVAYSGETGANYVEITNLRLTATDGTVYADEIAAGLVSYINTTNSSQINVSTALIDSPTVDINDAVYIDESPHRILTELAKIGDNGTPPNLYEWGVWENKLLHFRQKGSAGESWFTDAASLEIDSTVDTLVNSTYAAYRDEEGYYRQTATNTDAASIASYGLTRHRHVRTPTSDATEAAIWRDAVLDDGKDITPRARVVVREIFTSSGAQVPLWMVRAGDTLTIRNLPVSTSQAVDKIRTFIIARTSYDVDNDEITITPGSDTPTLDFLVAQNAAQIQRG